MKRLSMRKIREALRLRSEGFSARQIAKSLSLGRATTSDYIRRADVEDLTWPLANALSDADLERLLFPRTVGDLRGTFPQPDWSYVHTELRRKGVTLSLLWEEYRGVHPPLIDTPYRLPGSGRLRLQSILRTLHPLGR